MRSIDRSPARRPARVALACALALLPALLAGCAPDRPIPPTYFPEQDRSGYAAASADSPDLTPAAPPHGDSLTNSKDPLVQASGLDMAPPLSGGSDHLKQTDPLTTPNVASPDAPSPVDSDPFVRQNLVSDTLHSHWLKGAVVHATVEVRLNSARLPALFSNTDQDVTRNCHKGLNTVTFLYTPHGADSSALLNVLESEHDPPIPPLATFNSRDAAPDAAGGAVSDSFGNAPKTTTRTFTFIAQ